MSVELEKCSLSPMYDTIWECIKDEYNEIVYADHKMKIISNRIGLYAQTYSSNPYSSNSNPESYWYHICYPKILYWRIKELGTVGALTFKKNTTSNNSNHFKNKLTTAFNHIFEISCHKCKYKLTKQEQVLIKLALLGEKR